MPVRKILIIEDETTLSEMYKLKFEKEGHTVRTYADGLSGISVITSFLPDVILLDIMMPGMDGFEVLKTIRQLAPSLQSKILICSNLSSESDVQKAYALGADAYIIKANTTPGEILQKINALEFSEAPKAIVLESDPGDTHALSCPHCGKRVEVQVSVK